MIFETFLLDHLVNIPMASGVTNRKKRNKNLKINLQHKAKLTVGIKKVFKWTKGTEMF